MNNTRGKDFYFRFVLPAVHNKKLTASDTKCFLFYQEINNMLTP